MRYVKRETLIFRRILRQEYNRFAQAVENGNGASYAQQMLIAPPVLIAIKELYQTVGVRYARQAFNDRTKALTPSEWVQAILDYLGDSFYNKGTVKITATTRKHFLDILNESVMNGWGYLRTARYIRESSEVEEVIRSRAEMIARTETGKAIHSGKFVGSDKSVWEKEKIWISARDNRTRGNPMNGQKDKADHWNLDGQTVNLDEKFRDSRNGVTMEHPHDPEAPANEVINCRCTFSVVNKVDANGRLIRKRRSTVVIMPSEVRRPQVFTI